MSYLLTAATDAVNTLAQGVPNPPAQAPPGLDKFTNQILGWLKWGCGIAAIGACSRWPS